MRSLSSSCSISSSREVGLPLPANISNGTRSSSESNQPLITYKQAQSNCHPHCVFDLPTQAYRKLTILREPVKMFQNCLGRTTVPLAWPRLLQIESIYQHRQLLGAQAHAALF